MSFKSDVKNKIIVYYNRQLDAHESNIVRKALADEDFSIEKNPKPKKTEKIAIVVGSIMQFSGGHTSMLRLGTGLCELGKNITYISFNNQDEANMQEIAKANLACVKGKFLKYENADKSGYDIIIATSWQSVYYVRNFSGYKAYFVQDFEPYFFKLNERYLLAKKTYELGLHIISLGKWNLEQIKRNCNVPENEKLDYIDFPYEPKEYSAGERDYSSYSGKKKISFAVYSKEDGKRIPNLLQVMLEKASKVFNEKGYEIEVNFFGFNKSTKLSFGNNLGKLNKEEMKSLYEKSDFGIVASMTNISLVPYEMLAMGLPIVEFKDGSFPFFFPENTAMLVDYNYNSLVEEVIKSVENPNHIAEMMENSHNYLKTLSWKNSCKQFKDIIENI